jgi:acyl carrier protein
VRQEQRDISSPATEGDFFALQHCVSQLQRFDHWDPNAATETLRMDVQSARALIADHLAVDVETVRDEASFASDLGADSLDVIELAMRFEEALNVSIDDYETESCETVRDALDLIHSKTMARAAA